MTCVRPNRYHDTGFEPEPDNLKGLFKKISPLIFNILNCVIKLYCKNCQFSYYLIILSCLIIKSEHKLALGG